MTSHKMHARLRTLLYALGFGIEFLPMLVLGLFVVAEYQHQWLHREGLPAVGFAIRREVGASSLLGGNYAVYYRFRIGGRTYDGHGRVPRSYYEQMQAGDQIALHYAFDDPSQSELDVGEVEAGIWALYAILLAMFALWIAVMWGMTWRALQRQALLNDNGPPSSAHSRAKQLYLFVLAFIFAGIGLGALLLGLVEVTPQTLADGSAIFWLFFGLLLAFGTALYSGGVYIGWASLFNLDIIPVDV